MQLIFISMKGKILVNKPSILNRIKCGQCLLYRSTSFVNCSSKSEFNAYFVYGGDEIQQCIEFAISVYNATLFGIWHTNQPRNEGQHMSAYSYYLASKHILANTSIRKRNRTCDVFKPLSNLYRPHLVD